LVARELSVVAKVARLRPHLFHQHTFDTLVVIIIEEYIG